MILKKTLCWLVNMQPRANDSNHRAESPPIRAPAENLQHRSLSEWNKRGSQSQTELETEAVRDRDKPIRFISEAED